MNNSADSTLASTSFDSAMDAVIDAAVKFLVDAAMHSVAGPVAANSLVSKVRTLVVAAVKPGVTDGSCRGSGYSHDYRKWT